MLQLSYYMTLSESPGTLNRADRHDMETGTVTVKYYKSLPLKVEDELARYLGMRAMRGDGVTLSFPTNSEIDEFLEPLIKGRKGGMDVTSSLFFPAVLNGYHGTILVRTTLSDGKLSYVVSSHT